MWQFVVFVLFIILALLWIFKTKTIRKVWFGNIDELTAVNPYWRNVLATFDNMQVVVMNVPAGEELGAEVHSNTDQFFHVISGNGVLEVDGQRIVLAPNVAAVAPGGSLHNVRNTGNTNLQFYTIYAPAEHPEYTLQREKNNKTD